MFLHTWDFGTCSKDWKRFILPPTPKKSDKTVCELQGYQFHWYSSWALFSYPAKPRRWYSGLKNTRCGSRRERGCIDQIFILRQILGKQFNCHQSTTTRCIDILAACHCLKGSESETYFEVMEYRESMSIQAHVCQHRNSHFRDEVKLRLDCPRRAFLSLRKALR